ncbi:agmatinase family protein [Acaryochloris sp. CCMEE 5410]|uniref:agmatinase family protein n=1 Tax=Acaryochloris sp. CCMEE 5410 TaxID=310037 RepID=UPI00024846BF|nr:agmatinase family protein [Acaryochloris sp. CCMEE 5410]KAI9135155.1 agmatinase family protein [Acaryochloris sp. CCMEE 5410]
MTTFDPNGVGLENGNLFGLPFDFDSAQIIVWGIPWEVTVSYGSGTAQGPAAILRESPQLDLYDFDHPGGWQQGICLAGIPDFIQVKNDVLKDKAQAVIEYTSQGHAVADSPPLMAALTEVNQECRHLNQWIYQQAQTVLAQGKKLVLLGGDHSIPLGYLQALAEQHSEFGILQIDAHSDLRQAYQGFEYSHASIMTNVLKLPQVTKLVQVGVRDVCAAEVETVTQSQGRIVTYYDPDLKTQLYQGTTWHSLCQEMVAHLPKQVYISFDVDGLDPKLCPHTGTPVPGGLELEAAFHLCRTIVLSGRSLIGCDICEVGDGVWDGNVGARILYKLCNLMGLSQP